MNGNPLSPEPWATPSDPLGVRLSASAALAKIVSGDIPSACEELRGRGWKYAKPLDAGESEGLICSSWPESDHIGPTRVASVHVALRGTDVQGPTGRFSAADLLNDIRFWRRGPWKEAPGGGWYAAGARRHADAALPSIRKHLARLKNTLSMEVYIHCYSLSGAAGQMLVVPLALDGYDVRDCYPFNPPRPLGRGSLFRSMGGSQGWHARFCKRHKIRCWRIIVLRNGIHDWVTMAVLVPGARHAGETWDLAWDGGPSPQGGTVLVRYNDSEAAEVLVGQAATDGWRGLKKVEGGLSRWNVLGRLAAMPKAHEIEPLAEALARRELT